MQVFWEQQQAAQIFGTLPIDNFKFIEFFLHSLGIGSDWFSGDFWCALRCTSLTGERTNKNIKMNF